MGRALVRSVALQASRAGFDPPSIHSPIGATEGRSRPAWPGLRTPEPGSLPGERRSVHADVAQWQSIRLSAGGPGVQFPSSARMERWPSGKAAGC